MAKQYLGLTELKRQVIYMESVSPTLIEFWKRILILIGSVQTKISR